MAQFWDRFKPVLNGKAFAAMEFFELKELLSNFSSVKNTFGQVA